MSTAPSRPARAFQGDAPFVALALLLAAALRLAYFREIHGLPFFDVPFADAGYHRDWARRILAGDWASADQPVFWKPPLYPYLLAAVFRLFGESLTAVRGLQLAASLAAGGLLYWATREAFGRAAARVALLAAAIYAPFIYFDGEIEVASLAASLSVAATAAGLRAARPGPGGSAWWFAAGLASGLAALLHPSALLAGAVLAAWAAARSGRITPAGALAALLVASGIAAAVGPVTARNLRRGGEPVLISANGGVNFYLGNNERPEETLSIQPGHRWDRLMLEPSAALGRVPTPLEEDRWWYRRGLDWIRHHPLDYALSLGRRAVLFWQGREVKRNKDYEFARGQTEVLRAPLLSFAAVGPPALVGLALARPLAGARALLALQAGAVFLATVGFFVADRYRLPAVPALLPFAAWTACVLARRLRERRWRALAAPAGAVALLALFAHASPLRAPGEDPARSWHDLGMCLTVQGRYEEAIAAHREALRRYAPGDPAAADTRLQLAKALLFAEREGEAAEEAGRALAIYDDFAEARFVRGEAFRLSGALLEAREVLQRLPDRPEYGEGRYQLGLALADGGFPAEAVAELRRAAVALPGRADVLYDLGTLLEAAGEGEEAERAYVRAANVPAAGSTAALFRLALMRQRRGALDEAARLYERAIALDPGNFQAHNNLGAVRYRQGDYARAVAEFERALRLNPADEGTRHNLERAREKAGARAH